MKKLNRKAEQVFCQLLPTLPHMHAKLDNEPGVFMAVSVDRVREVPGMAGVIYSVAHNYIQNGDVMAVPDMEFLVCELGTATSKRQRDTTLR